MKYILHTIIFVLFLTNSAFAHDGLHKNVLSEDEISIKARDIVSLAISKKKIDKLWANSQIVEAQTKITNHSDEWVIKLISPAENSKQTELYLFFTLDGEFLAMNYTGK